MPTIWLVESEDVVGFAAARMGDDDFVLLPRDAALEVGRVADGDVEWLEQVEIDALPDPEPIADATARNGEVQRVEASGELVRALEGIAEAADTRGG